MNQGQQVYYDDNVDIEFATPAADTTSMGEATVPNNLPPSYADNTTESYSYASAPNPDQGLQSASLTGFLGSQLNSITDEDKQTLVVARAIPNTIRPPQVEINSQDPSNKIVRQISILFCGLIICSVSAFDAFVFLEFNYGNKLMYVAGFFWLCSSLLLVVGSLYGAYVGQWRMLAPGIVLSHLASFLLRLAV